MLLLILLASILAQIPLYQQEHSATPEVVRIQTKSFHEDLEFIYQTILENHPGLYNDKDPHFQERLNQNYSIAKWRLNNTYKEADQIAIVRQFIASFEDTHLGISYSNQKIMESKASRKFEIQALTPDIHWISLPSFKPNEDEITSLKQIIEHLPSLKNDQALIFDVRGNSGGNSLWCNEILSKLFGKEYAEVHLYEWDKDTYVEYRISDDNILHWQNCLTRISREFGEQNVYTQHLLAIITDMQESQKRGEKYYQVRTTLPSSLPTLPFTSFQSKIIVVIDSHCSSACLDFIDGLIAMKQPILLLGEATGADSIYMDCRSIELPSHRGKLTIPTKVYHNRPRGNNQPYFPDVIYTKDLSNTEELKSFVLAQLDTK